MQPAYRQRACIRSGQLTGLCSSSDATQLMCVCVCVKLVSDSYIVRLTGKPDQLRFTIIKVAVDRQEPIVLQC